MAWPLDYGNLSTNLTGYSLYGSNTVPEIWRDECLSRAMGRAIFPYFVTYWEDFSAQKGDTLHIPVSWNIPHSGTVALVSGTAINVVGMPITGLTVTLSEYGNGVGMERMLIDLSAPNIPQEARDKIARDWQYTMDKHVAATFNQGGHICYCMASGIGTFDYVAGGGGRKDPDGTIDGDILGTLWDKFQGDSDEYIVPPIDIPGYGEYYALIAHPQDTRTIKKSQGWQNLQLYNEDGQGILTARCGLYEGFVVFETNMGVTKGTALAFGADAVGMGVSTPFELAYYPDYAQDVGRAKVMKWLTVMGIGLGLADVGTHLIKVMT